MQRTHRPPQLLGSVIVLIWLVAAVLFRDVVTPWCLGRPTPALRARPAGPPIQDIRARGGSHGEEVEKAEEQGRRIELGVDPGWR